MYRGKLGAPYRGGRGGRRGAGLRRLHFLQSPARRRDHRAAPGRAAALRQALVPDARAARVPGPDQPGRLPAPVDHDRGGAGRLLLADPDGLPGIGAVRLGVPGDLLVAGPPADEPPAHRRHRGRPGLGRDRRGPGLGGHHRAVQGSPRARVQRGAALGGPALGPGPGWQPPVRGPAAAGRRGRPGRGDPARAEGLPDRGAHPPPPPGRAGRRRGRRRPRGPAGLLAGRGVHRQGPAGPRRPGEHRGHRGPAGLHGGRADQFTSRPRPAVRGPGVPARPG